MAREPDDYSAYASVVPSRAPTPPEPQRPQGIVPTPPPLAPQVTMNTTGTMAGVDRTKPETLDQLRHRSGGR